MSTASKSKLTVETVLQIFGGYVIKPGECQHCAGCNGRHRIVRRVWPRRVDFGCHFCGRSIENGAKK